MFNSGLNDFILDYNSILMNTPFYLSSFAYEKCLCVMTKSQPGIYSAYYANRPAKNNSFDKVLF